MALIDAPIFGTGKSLLAEIVYITATGDKNAAVGVQIGNAEETRKNITAQLRETPAIINIDNVTDTIKSPILAAVLTAPVVKDRLLGKSQILTLPVRSVFIATGNNLRVGGDMPRRCFYVRIDANAVQPWMRGGFKHELPDYAIENRGRIVAGLLTMARAWICAGRPRGDNPILGSFKNWCYTVGGILQYAGLSGFLGNLDEMRVNTADGEDDADQWNAWMMEIYVRFNNKTFTVYQLAEAINSYGALGLKEDVPFSLGEIGPSLDRTWLTRLGLALHTHKGQIFGINDERVKLIQIVDKHTKKKSYSFMSIGDANDMA
jgi:hypothetical protein